MFVSETFARMLSQLGLAAAVAARAGKLGYRCCSSDGSKSGRASTNPTGTADQDRPDRGAAAIVHHGGCHRARACAINGSCLFFSGSLRSSR